ncbi:hypothetical protein T02_13608, partial [Trichinella nativa]
MMDESKKAKKMPWSAEDQLRKMISARGKQHKERNAAASARHLVKAWSWNAVAADPNPRNTAKEYEEKKRPTNHFPPDENTSIQSHQISTIHFNIDQQLDQQVKKMYPTNMLINSFIISSLILF